MELLIVGLDGLSWNMLDRFDIDADYLTTVADAGISGDLMSVDTPTTTPAWTSFATGKDPGSHGVTNMTEQNSHYEITPSQSNKTDAAVYDFLDDAIFINLPASETRQPTGENVSVVSSFTAKDKYEAVPDELHDLDAFEQYVSSYDSGLKSRPGRFVEHICEIAESRSLFAREAFETYDPDVGFILFSATDWVGHNLVNSSDFEQRREWYSQVVETVDECTAKLADSADNVLLMSDHGFEHKHTAIHVNDCPLDEGYLAERANPGFSPERAMVNLAKKVATRSDYLYNIMRRVYNVVIGTQAVSGLQDAARMDIDYSQTKAWELRYGAIFINDDRFAHPTVENSEALKEELRTRLRSLTDDDGTPVFRDVYFASEVYEDPINEVPDIIARPSPGYFPMMLRSPKSGYTSPTDNYDHRYHGLFAATGPLFESGGTVVDDVRIIDVLPTVLHTLGHPISPDFDGAVRHGLLSNAVDPIFMDRDDIPEPVAKRTTQQEDEDRTEAARGRLEDLGYLE